MVSIITPVGFESFESFDYGLVKPYGKKTGSTLAQVMNGLLPEGTKALLEPMLINHQWLTVRSYSIHLRAIP